MDNQIDDDPSEHGESHVHFPEDQLPEHDAEIVIKHSARGEKLDVHLGFLQFNHSYEVKFSIKDNLGEDVEADPLQNLHARLLSVQPSSDGEGHNLVLEFSAHKEKLMRERLVLQSCGDKNKTQTLIIHARVLGKGKGTPSLKNGIHVTKVAVDEDSEMSDWQGFR